MKYEVFLTKQAEEDIIEIYDYVAKYDSVRKAHNLIEKIHESCLSLKKHPNRGHSLPELERINLRDFLEIHYKPYRIIYQIRKKEIYIHSICDGRRNMQEVLAKKLLRI